MNCLSLGFWLVTVSLVVSLLLGLGVAALGRFRPIHAVFRFLAPAVMIVIVAAMFMTVAGVRESFRSTHSGLVVLNFVWSVIASLFELAMLSGVIVMSGCRRVNGRLVLEEVSFTTRVLERWFGHWGTGLYKTKKEEERSICGVSWIVTGLIFVYLIGIVWFAIANFFTIGFTRQRVYFDQKDFMKLGAVVLGFPPLISLILAGLFGTATWLIVRSIGGIAGWLNWPVFSGSLIFWFILFSVGYAACIQALWLVLKWLISLVALSIAGVDYDEKKVLKYSPLLLLVIACAIAMPLMAVTAKEMNLPPLQFYLSLFFASVVVFVILMFACSELQLRESRAIAAAEAVGPRQGGGEMPQPVGGSWFPTLSLVMGTLKRAACPLIKQDE